MTQAAIARGAQEVLPGVHRLGDTISVDGWISWAPADAGLYQHLNCYLVLEDDAATLIDTCPAALEDAVVSQLQSVLPETTPLSIFLTRAEYEVIGNVGAVHTAHPIEHLMAGGVANIYDSYDEVAGFSERWEERQYIDRILPGEVVSFGASGRFEVLGTPLRLLTSFWIYDRETKALFSTDVFGHTTMRSPDGPLVVPSVEDDTSTLESVREHVLARYPWIEYGDTSVIRQNLAKIFEGREITAILPCHGAILLGEEVVQRHYEFLQAVLAGRRGEA